MIINRHVRVAIAFEDGRGESRCDGPSADGNCPRTTITAPVACAGAEILPLRGTSADGQRLLVHGNSVRCPLAALTQVTPAPWD